MKGKDAIGTILKAEGVEVITGFPHNPIFDGAASVGIRPIIGRTERVAANIADGLSRVSGGRSIGVCAVQYGPGAENVFGAVAQAYADASPLLLLPSGYESRESAIAPNFQVIRNYGAVTKWMTSINRADRLPQVLRHAFSLLRTGKPGPVVVEVPDDFMDAEVGPFTYKPTRHARAQGDPDQVRDLVKTLLAAKAPLIVAGQGVLYAEAWDELRAFAELTGTPVMTTLAGKSAFPENHPLSLGAGGNSRPAMVDKALARADFVLGIGTSFTLSSYTTQVPAGKIIAQVTNEPGDVNKHQPIAHAVIGDARAVLAQMIEAARSKFGSKGKARAAAAAKTIKADRDAFMKVWGKRLASDAEPISPYRVIAELMRVADRTKTVVTHESGNPRDQVVPFYESIAPHGYIGWGKSTQLGTSLGLAMGAKLAKPDWLSVNVMGDAAFGMVGMDFETAVRSNIPILTIVLNNGVMGGYTHHHPVATQRYRIHRLGGDYALVAQALGGHGERVEKVKDLGPALKRAIAKNRAGTPALVEVITREEPEFPVG
ncbi:MAG: thiamine pyrophosphate-requiring protein [Alphaproteobacteria bacterium]|nr:thiamine pyrophosphate-requiring protein [Alphaproteobacteria bacterium]